MNYFKQEILMSPNNFHLLTQSAILYLFSYEDAKAVRLLLRALSLNPRYAPALVAMGDLMRFTGKSKLA